MEYLAKMFGLEGKTSVVTGGGGVLAGAIAEALHGAGSRVSLWGRGEASLKSAVERLAGSPGAAAAAGTAPTGNASAGTDARLHWCVADAGDETEVAKALSATEDALGMPELLVNGVGGTMGKGAFVDVDPAGFEEVLRLNLVAGLVVPTKVVARRWIERGVKGAVVNIASMGSFVPLSGVWAYDAAKAGVMNLTMACAKEFAPHGIRVNAVAPGFFLGRQNRALLVDSDTGALTARGRAVIERTPFGRFGEARELAGAVLFLANPNASGFVTGVTIPVDGGFLVDNI